MPVLHVEIVDAEAFAEAADLAEETLLSYEDDPIELERRIAEDEGVDAFAPGPAPEEDANAADLIPAEGASAPSAASAPTGSFNARRLLRIGGIGGGIRGAGMRAGIGGVRRFGGGGGYGRAGLGRRNRSMATNQVLAASYYGQRGARGASARTSTTRASRTGGERAGRRERGGRRSNRREAQARRDGAFPAFFSEDRDGARRGAHRQGLARPITSGRVLVMDCAKPSHSSERAAPSRQFGRGSPRAQRARTSIERDEQRPLADAIRFTVADGI